MKTRVLVAVAIVGVLAAACTSESTTSTTAPYSGPVCFYLDGYIAVAPEDAGAAQEELGVEVIPASDVLAATSQEGEQPPDDIDAIDNAIAEAVAFLPVEADPFEVASQLVTEAELSASPITVMGFTNHIKFQPGTDPSAVAGFDLPDVFTSNLDDAYVAVVDSGIVAPLDAQAPEPRWFYGTDDSNLPFVTYESMDEEILDTGNPASHGTFVSSLIRQIAFEKPVTFASARLIAEEVVAQQGPESLPPGLAPTAEIQVAEAIARLMIRHQGEAISALNLSLGAYLCDPGSDTELVTLSGMMTSWLTQKFQGSHIITAGGNENYKTAAAAGPQAFVPFYPAGLAPGPDRSVHAVAAVSGAGDEIVWVDKSPVTIGTGDRPWITDWAPGADLVSLGWRPDVNSGPGLACWSGSSFASAVASAQLATGTTPSTPDYGAIDGLTYFDEGRGQLVTVGGNSAPFAEGCDHDAEG